MARKKQTTKADAKAEPEGKAEPAEDTSPETVTRSVTFPHWLWKLINERAAAEDRSFSGQVVRFCRVALDHERQLDSAKK